MVKNIQAELDKALLARDRLLEKGQSVTYKGGDGVERVSLSTLNEYIQELKMELAVSSYPIL